MDLCTDSLLFFVGRNLMGFHRYELMKLDAEYPDDGSTEFTPLIFTVGVIPGSTTTPAASHNAAKDLKELLLKHGITDRVDIEFTENVFWK